MSEGEIPLGIAVNLLALLWLLAALFSVLGALITRSGPIRLRHWAENAGDVLRNLFHRRAEFEAFRFLLVLLARLTLVLLVVAAWFSLGDGHPLLWPTLGAVLLSVIVLEWVNQRLVEWYAEKALQRLTGLLRFAYTLLRAPIWLTAHLVAYADDEGDEDVQSSDEASEGEIDAFIDVGLREGILEPEEEDLVRSIVEFSDTLVRSVMTPRVEIVAASSTSSFEEIAEVFFDSKHARLPIYGDSIDQIVGILHIRDLFEALHRPGSQRTLAELANPPLYVPEGKTLGNLLEEMQALHQQMAIVVDEYGGVAGLVTVEDLVEEIVGEISDEHETADAEQERLKDGAWRVQGRTHVEDLAALFAVDFNGLPYETVSGLICGELGYVPEKGSVFETHGLTMVIEEADERRVEAVIVRPAEAPQDAVEGA